MVIKQYLTFAGANSLDYGVQISGGGTYNAPQRVYEAVEVPGRNGNLMIDQNRYANIEVTYPAFIARNFHDNIEGWRNWLLSHLGYQRLEDTYHPDEYRMACFSDMLEVETTTRNAGGRFNINFNCKPQRFLKIGEERKAVTSGSKLINPTLFPARPYIRIYGSGTVTLGSQTITVTAHNKSYMDVDSELQDCFCGSDNLNNYATFSDDTFPVLEGDTTVTFTSGITALEIAPRWWRL